MFEATIIGWAATVAAIACLIAFDLWQSRSPHPVGLREAAGWSLFYVAVAVLFGGVLGVVADWGIGAQYFAGYVVERGLSIDNLFVFVVIISTFAVPPVQQPRLLMIGIAAALALRTAFIALGAVMLDAFSLTYLVFGLGLIATGVQLFRHRDADPSIEDNPVVAAARRRGVPPMLLALLAIATADLVFALDSVPAVFGVTSHAYVVFAANAFALIGLRPLYFLVSGLLDRLVCLSSGLAVVLGFIGVKLMLEFFDLHISTAVSLGVIALVLAITTVASLGRVPRRVACRQ